jgi:hypothetical protein
MGVHAVEGSGWEWMEPGGSHGLQNRSRPDHVGLGGFDPHALPPPDPLGRCHGIPPVNHHAIRHASRRRTPRCVRAGRVGALVLGLVALSSAVRAQRPDTVARAIPAPSLRGATDSVTAPLSPRRAFLYSFLLPGYAQSVLGRHKAGATFMLVEAISLVMIRESVADVREARRLEGDSIVVSYVDQFGGASVVKTPRQFDDAYVHVRRAHAEDWAALLVANHLFAGADAFVSANLWDLPAKLGLHLLPGGAVVSASMRW